MLKKKKNSNIEKNIEIIFKKFPVVRTVQEIFQNFHHIMFSFQPDNINSFIDTYKEFIPTFCNEIKKDIAPVKSVISFEINSNLSNGKSNLCNLSKRSYISFCQLWINLIFLL